MKNRERTLRTMHSTIECNKNIEPDDYIFIGGFTMQFGDRTVAFDFEEYEETVDEKDPRIIRFKSYWLDVDCYPLSQGITAEDVVRLASISEFVVYSGKSNAPSLYPVKLRHLAFEFTDGLKIDCSETQAVKDFVFKKDKPVTHPEMDWMMTLSTAHITEKTANMLDDDIRDEISSLVVYPKIGMPRIPITHAHADDIERESYGWFIHIPQDDISDDLHELDIPNDLLACVRYADSHGCAWLCLDRDGCTVDELPQYEW